MTSPELETRRPPTGPGFLDAVTLSFGDVPQGVFGFARLSLGDAGASAIGALFGAQELVASYAVDADAPEGADWSELALGAVRTGTAEPLARWQVSLETDGGGFDLTFQALAAPASFRKDADPALAGGPQGYEQLCRVQGAITANGVTQPIDCLGQRGHSWGAIDWGAIESVRSLSAWLGPDAAVFVSAVRPRDAAGHAEDALAAVLAEGYGADAELADAAEVRVSTGYDGEGRERRAGLELLVSEEDDFPRRAAGEALCAITGEAGGLRVDTSFMLWRMDGRAGVGRVERVRRA